MDSTTFIFSPLFQLTLFLCFLPLHFILIPFFKGQKAAEYLEAGLCYVFCGFIIIPIFFGVLTFIPWSYYLELTGTLALSFIAILFENYFALKVYKHYRGINKDIFALAFFSYLIMCTLISTAIKFFVSLF